MPGIDFDKLRQEISMEDVLDLLGFTPTQRRGAQWYGPCPLHENKPGRVRVFSVNIAFGRYCCHKCRSRGNQLDLWSAYTKLPLHPATIALCQALPREVPWIRHW